MLSHILDREELLEQAIISYENNEPLPRVGLSSFIAYAEQFPDVPEAIEEEHPHDVPEIIHKFYTLCIFAQRKEKTQNARHAKNNLAAAQILQTA